MCRGCGKTFHHMQTLLRHIRNRRCPGTLEEAVPPKINEPLPLMRRAELVEAWHVGGVKALLLALGSSELSKELLHHCCICRQWTSDHRHFKTHIKRAHPDLHTSCHELALADCRGLSGEIMNPCPFCKQSVTNRTRHVMACPVLYQAALSCRAHGRTIQGECHLTLLGRASSSKPTVEPEATGHATERQEGSVELRATAQVSEVRQAQGGRQRQAKGPPTTRGIQSFFARQCGKPVNPAHGTTVPQKRGCHQHPSYGQGLCHDVQDEGRGDHAPNNQGPGNQMARTQGRWQNGVLQADCPVQRCDPGAPDAREGATGEGREDQAFDQPGLARQPLVWSVASQKDIPCPDLGPLPHTQAMRCLDIILEHATSQIVQRFHSTRPLAREYRGEVMEFLLEVSLQGPTPESSRGTGTAEQLRALVPCGSQIEARGPQEVLGGEQAAAPTCRQVLTLSLRNPGNLCYQNAFVMSWLWSITNATHQVREHGDGLGRSGTSC